MNATARNVTDAPIALPCDAVNPCDQDRCPYCDPVGFYDDAHADLRINGKPA